MIAVRLVVIMFLLIMLLLDFDGLIVILRAHVR
jgi:hypothetical protein